MLSGFATLKERTDTTGLRTMDFLQAETGVSVRGSTRQLPHLLQHRIQAVAA
jgi:hypothetical protein